MKTLKFKTNVNCGGCIATVTPYLNKLSGIDNWSVGTTNPNKILTVETPDLDAQVIIEVLKEAGYKGEVIA